MANFSHGSGRAPNTTSNPVFAMDTDNVTIAAANTEQSYTFPAGVVRFSIRSVGHSTLKIAGTAGKTATKPWRIRPGTMYEEGNLDALSSFTIYLQGNRAGETVELKWWV